MNKVKKINKNEEIDNKVKDGTETLDKPEHKRAIQEMNEAMDYVRKDYKFKDSNSQAAASKIVLTT